MLREHVERMIHRCRHSRNASARVEFRDTDSQQTLEHDNTQIIRIIGYATDTKKIILAYFGYILTLGLLRLVFHWFPKWRMKCTNRRENLCCAERLLIEDNYQEKWITYAIANINLLHMRDGNKHVYYVNNNTLREYKKVLTFTYKSITYVLDKNRFVPLEGLSDGLCQNTLHSFEPLSQDENSARMNVYGPNEIRVPLTSILQLVLLEVMTPFYIFQALSVILWFIEGYIYFAIVIIILAVLGVGSHVYQTRKNQKLLRSKVKLKDTVVIFRKSGPDSMISEINTAFISEEESDSENIHKLQVSSTDLVPGDIMDVQEGYAYCDAILLSGTCLVDESMLTGESVQVLKTPVPNNSNIFNMEDGAPHVLFAGTRIVQTNGTMKALVLKTGFLTSKGTLVRSIMYPPPVDYKFDRDSLKYCLIMFLIGVILAVYFAYEKGRRDIPIGDLLIKTLDSITILIPAVLPIVMTIGKLHAINNLKKVNIFCTNPNVMNIAGSVNCICLDKTGTITEDQLQFVGVVPKDEEHLMKAAFPEKITEGMSSCHNLAIYQGELQGDPMEVQMFKAVGSKMEDNGKVYLQTGDEVKVLERYQFSSNLRRMSVVIKSSQGVLVFSKGSPEVIGNLCKGGPNSETLDIFTELVKNGYRVLAIAFREIPEVQEVGNCTREEIEKDLTFLGYLVFENKLKEPSLDTILQLKKADFDVKMITGDNIETAISVAKECQIIPSGGNVKVLNDLENFGRLETIQGVKNFQNTLVLNEYFALSGNSWAVIYKHSTFIRELLPKVKVFARMTSQQKSQVIEALQASKFTVCMCGDGTNDCSALKASNVGVSLAESDASIAAPLTSKIPDISAILHVVRQGRAALVTLLFIVQLVVAVNVIQYTGVFMLYEIDASFSDTQFMFLDGHTLMYVFFVGSVDAYSGPLSPKAPVGSLMAPKPIFSLLSHLIVTVVFQIVALGLLRSTEWFVPYIHDPAKGNDFLCYENYVIFVMCLFQFISVPIIFSKSKPYRKPLWTNWKLDICMMLFLIVNLLLTLWDNDQLNQVFNLMVPQHYGFRWVLVGLGIGHLVTCLILEEIVLGYCLDKLSEKFSKKDKVLQIAVTDEYF